MGHPPTKGFSSFLSVPSPLPPPLSGNAFYHALEADAELVSVAPGAARKCSYVFSERKLYLGESGALGAEGRAALVLLVIGGLRKPMAPARKTMSLAGIPFPLQLLSCQQICLMKSASARDAIGNLSYLAPFFSDPTWWNLFANPNCIKQRHGPSYLDSRPT